MRTIVAGLDVVRRTPLAVAPILVEAVVAASLMMTGVIPSTAASAMGTAAFPLDVFFDLKQTMTSARSWPFFVVIVLVTMMGRAAVLAATAWLADEQHSGYRTYAIAALRISVTAAVLLFPGAALFFIGVAARYAPFIWIAALTTFVPALVLARRAASLKGAVRAVPAAGGYLTYGYAIAVIGAAMSSLSGISPWISAIALLCAAPLHALVYLGWRAHARAETYSGGGTIAIAVTVALVLVLTSGTVYDRFVRRPAPVARATVPGELLLLGGVDSTLTSGALAGLDPRQVGFDEHDVTRLSYRGVDLPTTRADTHRDLDAAAMAVAAQVRRADRPADLLGHSQAGLIVDRLLDRGLTAPDRSAVISDPPPFPPSVAIPAPHVVAPGKPGGDVARAFARILDVTGFTAYQVDSPSFPTDLDPVVVISARVPRLSVWALGDSVWLDRDWRRPGEINLVALSDHVGATNDARALATIRAFFQGHAVGSDETSWRGALVAVVQHLFAPWRPMEGH
ncbi:MAG TPA: hypothetical protein VFK89_07710 [Actinomycetota bacterium]|nr:hypothetical protein [Actinomycetota bacterium]